MICIFTYVLYNMMSGIQIRSDSRRIDDTPSYSSGFQVRYSSRHCYKITRLSIQSEGLPRDYRMQSPFSVCFRDAMETVWCNGPGSYDAPGRVMARHCQFKFYGKGPLGKHYLPSEKFHQLLAVGRWFPPGTPVSSTRKLISSSSFLRHDMTLAVVEALNPNKPNQTIIYLWRANSLLGMIEYTHKNTHTI